MFSLEMKGSFLWGKLGFFPLQIDQAEDYRICPLLQGVFFPTVCGQPKTLNTPVQF